MRAGNMQYLQAARLEVEPETKTFKDVTEAGRLYREAYASFQKASDLQPQALEPRFMMVKTGEQLLRRANQERNPDPLPNSVVQRLRREIHDARQELRRQDPSGERLRLLEENLSDRLKARAWLRRVACCPGSPSSPYHQACCPGPEIRRTV